MSTERRDARRYVDTLAQEALALHDDSALQYADPTSGPFERGVSALVMYSRRVASRYLPTPSVSTFSAKLSAIMSEHRVSSWQLRSEISDLDLGALRDASNVVAEQYVGLVKGNVLLPIEGPPSAGSQSTT